MSACEKREMQLEHAIEVKDINALIDIANDKIDAEMHPVRITALMTTFVIEELVEGKRGWKITYKTNHDKAWYKVYDRELDSPQHYLPYTGDHAIRVESVRDCVNRIVNN